MSDTRPHIIVTVHRLRSITTVCAALVLTGCGSASTSLATGSTSATAPAATASPAPTPKSELLFAVVEVHSTHSSPGQVDDTVAIVGLDGYARNKVTISPLRRPPEIGNAAAVLRPDATVAAHRVYYIDGKGVVRSLGPVRGSTSRSEATFAPPSPQGYESFAVSPDGNHLIAAVDDISPLVQSTDSNNPLGFSGAQQLRDTIEVADSGGATRALRTISSPEKPLFIGGWDAISPIALSDPILGTQNTLPGGWNSPAVRLDARGQITTSIGGAGCRAVEDTADGSTTLCLHAFSPDVLDNPAEVRSTDRTWQVHTPKGTFANADLHLSPDGAAVVLLVVPSAPTTPGADESSLIVARKDGTSVELLHGREFRPQGWLDATTVIGTIRSPQQGQFTHLALIRTASPGKVDDLGFEGAFIGVVQTPG
jgi:hypothetical protein